MKKGSVKTKLVSTIIYIFVGVTIVFSAVSAYAIYTSTFTSLKATMIETVGIAADNVSTQLQVFDKILSEVASNDILRDANVSEKDKVDFLAEKTEQYKEYDCNFFVADKEAHVLGTELDISDRDFFTEGIQGNHYLSSPLIRKDTGKLSFSYTVPVVDANENRIGILYMMFDYNALFKVVDATAIGKTGGAYVINQNGDTVMYSDEQMVIDKYNTAEEAESDSSLKALANLETKATRGETGFGTYTYGGKTKILSYAPITGTNGWAFIVTAARSEFMGGLFSGIIMSVICCIAAAVIGIMIMTKLANNIANPLKEIEKVSKEMADGNFNVEIDYKGKDELGSLADSMRIMVSKLSGVIKNLNQSLATVANGDFNISSDVEYPGDLATIKSSMNSFVLTISHTLAQINDSSTQVAGSAEQISQGAQSLTEGATDQASSIQELQTTVIGVTKEVDANAKSAGIANAKAQDVGTEIEEGNRQMQQMVDAMNQISETSKEINNIINTINDIASQTNLLSLNASIEAARAGEMGKGFAVVANEVGSLAAQSAQAAKNSTELIVNALQAVENGKVLADITAEKLKQSAVQTQELVTQIGSISDASTRQASALEQIADSVEQIASVVEENTAMAEESSASSEELSSQAQLLKDLIGKFVLVSE